jgi:hypothetical protein
VESQSLPEEEHLHSVVRGVCVAVLPLPMWTVAWRGGGGMGAESAALGGRTQGCHQERRSGMRVFLSVNPRLPFVHLPALLLSQDVVMSTCWVPATATATVTRIHLHNVLCLW